jgi:hypothetical protein
MESSKETPAEVRILKRTQKGIHTLVFEQYSNRSKLIAVMSNIK